MVQEMVWGLVQGMVWGMVQGLVLGNGSRLVQGMVWGLVQGMVMDWFGEWLSNGLRIGLRPQDLSFSKMPLRYYC